MFASSCLVRAANVPRTAANRAVMSAPRGAVRAKAFLGLGGATATGGIYDITVKVCVCVRVRAFV
jgi:hypothetical protein